MVVLSSAIGRSIRIVWKLLKESHQLHQRPVPGRRSWLFERLDMHLQRTVHRQIHRFVWSQNLAIEMGLQYCHTRERSRGRAWNQGIKGQSSTLKDLQEFDHEFRAKLDLGLQDRLEQPLHLCIRFIELCRGSVISRSQQPLQLWVQAKAERMMRSSSSAVMSPCQRSSLSLQ